MYVVLHLGAVWRAAVPWHAAHQLGSCTLKFSVVDVHQLKFSVVDVHDECGCSVLVLLAGYEAALGCSVSKMMCSCNSHKLQAVQGSTAHHVSMLAALATLRGAWPGMSSNHAFRIIR